MSYRIKRADGKWYLGLSNEGLLFTDWQPHAAFYTERRHAAAQVDYLKRKGHKVKLES